MNLDELRSVQSKERQKDSLQNLRPSFYQEVGEYIATLEDERDRVAEQADDPFSSPEVSRLTDEIETAKDVVEAIYERRMGKLVKQASLAAAGMAADDEGLTAEEADLFDDLVERIGSNKSRVLDVLEGVDTEAAAGADAETASERGPETETGSGAREGVSESGSRDPSPPGSDDRRSEPDPDGDSEPATGLDSVPGQTTADETPPVPPQDPPADTESTAAADGGVGAESDSGDDSSGVTPADVMGGDGPTIDDSSNVDSTSTADPQSDADATGSGPDADGADDVDRVTVKITRDIGSILGVDDREYSLSTDDVVTLPEQNATPLVDQEAAEPLE
ncbi:hypothetical protein [Natronorubrum halophilum]|uniref:hypothetical protein n=1 Tax=Natronorubrum halophilum TaxID=1702106 RepID=UPI000EF6784A|nr:hypothetical protein [Natronorubrum halophilum]